MNSATSVPYSAWTYVLWNHIQRYQNINDQLTVNSNMSGEKPKQNISTSSPIAVITTMGSYDSIRNVSEVDFCRQNIWKINLENKNLIKNNLTWIGLINSYCCVIEHGLPWLIFKQDEHEYY
jgi:hypothetical protein